MSDSGADSEFDGEFDGEFDTDDELRALLRGGDPAGSFPPADPAALATLLEDIMSADLEVRPEPDHGARAVGTRRPNRYTWLVAAAAAAVIAAVGGFAIAGLSGDDSPPPQADHQPTGQPAQGTAPVAGTTTQLTVADQPGKCAAPTPQIIAQYDQAFVGTVTAIQDDTVTLQATDVYNGEVGETVQVSAPQPAFDSMVDAVGFQVGQSYVVAAYDGQVSTCYSGSASGDLRSPFEKAFVH